MLLIYGSRKSNLTKGVPRPVVSVAVDSNSPAPKPPRGGKPPATKWPLNPITRLLADYQPSESINFLEATTSSQGSEAGLPRNRSIVGTESTHSPVPRMMQTDIFFLLQKPNSVNTNTHDARIIILISHHSSYTIYIYIQRLKTLNISRSPFSFSSSGFVRSGAKRISFVSRFSTCHGGQLF